MVKSAKESDTSASTLMSKFDESWTCQQLKIIKRCKYPDHFKPVPRVTSGSGSDPSILSQETIAFLDERWRETINTETGIQNYQELVEKIREEFAKR